MIFIFGCLFIASIRLRMLLGRGLNRICSPSPSSQVWPAKPFRPGFIFSTDFFPFSMNYMARGGQRNSRVGLPIHPSTLSTDPSSTSSPYPSVIWYHIRFLNCTSLVRGYTLALAQPHRPEKRPAGHESPGLGREVTTRYI